MGGKGAAGYPSPNGPGCRKFMTTTKAETATEKKAAFYALSKQLEGLDMLAARIDGTPQGSVEDFAAFDD